MTIWYMLTVDRDALKPTIIFENNAKISTIEASLQSLGHKVYWPREKIAVTRLNKRIKIERSLLYQYVFLGIEKNANFFAISQAKGVYQILEDVDGTPAQVSQRDVDRFRRNEHYGLYDHTRRGKGLGPLKKGEWVVAIDGPFENWQGQVMRCGRFKAWVLLGGKMTIEFPVEHLSAT